MKTLWVLTRIGFYVFLAGLFICTPAEIIYRTVNDLRGDIPISTCLIATGMLMILIGFNPWKPLPTAKAYYHSKKLWTVSWALLIALLSLALPYKVFGIKVLEPALIVLMIAILPLGIWDTELMRRKSRQEPTDSHV